MMCCKLVWTMPEWLCFFKTMVIPKHPCFCGPIIFLFCRCSTTVIICFAAPGQNTLSAWAKIFPLDTILTLSAWANIFLLVTISTIFCNPKRSATCVYFWNTDWWLWKNNRGVLCSNRCILKFSVYLYICSNLCIFL